MLHDVLIPRGNPLTEVMELTARDGQRWVAYVDGLPPLEGPRPLLKQTILPRRRLRFDSATESRVNPELPAGAPFLTEGRLLGLLGLSRILSAVEPPPPSRARPRRRRWISRISYRRALQARGRRAIADAAHATRLAVEALLVRALNSLTCVQIASPTSWVQEAERVTRHSIEPPRPGLRPEALGGGRAGAPERARRYQPAVSGVPYIRRESVGGRAAVLSR
jgi:hypothetical protein